MRQYKITMTGTTPLLMHSDSVEWADKLQKYREKNKKTGVKGDDRSPPWTWIGYPYFEGGKVGMCTDNISTMMREAAAGIVVPGAKGGKKTFKSQSQSGIIVDDLLWPIITPLGEVASAPVHELEMENDFAIHEQRARELGFRLFVKRVRMPGSNRKNVRVRPCFDTWTLIGTLTVLDQQITTEILTEIYSIGGEYKGIGDWRPSSGAPGQYGKFVAKVEEI